MSEQQMDAMAQRLAQIERTLKGVFAASWDKLDACDRDRLSYVRGQVRAEIDGLHILQGKQPEIGQEGAA